MSDVSLMVLDAVIISTLRLVLAGARTNDRCADR